MRTSFKKGTSSGFTLIEMIVAVSIFTVVMVMAVTLLLTIVASNTKAQTLQSTLSNLNIALDGMSRAMRVGTGYACSGASPCTSFSFTSQEGNHVTYSYDSSAHAIDRQVGTGATIPVTGPDVYIDNMQFFQKGTAQYPYVIFNIHGCAGNTGGQGCAGILRTESSFSIQTAVSERDAETP